MRPEPAHRNANLVTMTETGQANIDAAIYALEDIEDEVISQIEESLVDDLRFALDYEWGKPAAVVKKAR